MAKKTGKRVRHFTRRIKHSRHRMTPVKIIKYGIALGAPIASTYELWKSTGNAKSALNRFQLHYGPVDFETGQINTAYLSQGYGSLLGAWLFGKVASRVLR